MNPHSSPTTETLQERIYHCSIIISRAIFDIFFTSEHFRKKLVSKDKPQVAGLISSLTDS